MPVADEDGTGIWHRRYYLDGTHMAELADSGTGRAAVRPGSVTITEDEEPE